MRGGAESVYNFFITMFALDLYLNGAIMDCRTIALFVTPAIISTLTVICLINYNFFNSNNFSPTPTLFVSACHHVPIVLSEHNANVKIKQPFTRCINFGVCIVYLLQFILLEPLCHQILLNLVAVHCT